MITLPPPILHACSGRPLQPINQSKTLIPARQIRKKSLFLILYCKDTYVKPISKKPFFFAPNAQVQPIVEGPLFKQLTFRASPPEPLILKTQDSQIRYSVRLRASYFEFLSPNGGTRLFRSQLPSRFGWRGYVSGWSFSIAEFATATPSAAYP